MPGLVLHAADSEQLAVSVTLMLAEDVIGMLLLIRRHAGIERLEGRDEPLQPIGVLVGHDLVDLLA